MQLQIKGGKAQDAIHSEYSQAVENAHERAIIHFKCEALRKIIIYM